MNWLIIGKISHPDPSLFRSLADGVDSVVQEVKSKGVRVLVDYTDDILVTGDHRSQWTLGLLERADCIVCASQWLASSVRRSVAGSARIVVIADPLEGVRQAAHCLAQPGEVLRLVWFGHPTNLQPMLNLIPSLDPLKNLCDFALEIVAGLPPRQLVAFHSQFQQLRLRYPLTLTPWAGQASVFEALRRSHVALIPIDRRGPKVAASNNRLTEALWAGCFVVGSPVSSDLVTPRAIGGRWEHALAQV